MGHSGVSSFPGAAGNSISGLVVRSAPRGRRRPHCRHRQRNPQADAGRQAAGGGRLHVFPRPLNHRDPRLAGDCRGGAGAAKASGPLPRDRRGDRHTGFLGFPAGHCGSQPHHPALGVRHLPARAPRRTVRGRGPGPAAGEPRLPGADIQAHLQDDPAQLAHVSAGLFVWPGFRYGDGDWSPGDFRGRSVARAATVGNCRFSRALSPPACRSSTPWTTS